MLVVKLVLMHLVSTKWEPSLLPNAGCCLKLQNVEVNFQVPRSGDRRVVLLRETRVSGRKVDRRVLAINVDAELGLITFVWDRTGQMTGQSIPERSCTRVWSDSSR